MKKAFVNAIAKFKAHAAPAASMAPIARIVPAAVIAAMALDLSTANSAHAQCEPQWQPFDPSTAAFPGVTGEFGNGTGVSVLLKWDPTGGGAATTKLVVGGAFTLAGDALATSIAAYSPTTGQWERFGPGINNWVHALTALPDGDLVAGGEFTQAGGVGASKVARWDFGTQTWIPMGTGVSGGLFNTAYALATLPDGLVAVGGSFDVAGGIAAKNIARWNPATQAWVPWGAGFSYNTSGGAVYALSVLPSGELIAGGVFTKAGLVNVNCIAKWDGSVWAPLGSGLDSTVYSIAQMPSGHLVVGGDFTLAGGTGAKRVARWDGSTWGPLGGGVSGGNDEVRSLVALANGDVIAGGEFTDAGGVPVSRIARWSGVSGSWSAMSTGTTAPVRALTTLPDGQLVAGGQFGTAGGVSVNRIAAWDEASSAWTPLNAGFNSILFTIEALPNGDVVTGGWATKAGGTSAPKIVRKWDGATWETLGTGMTGPSTAIIHAFASLLNGDLIAAGAFYFADGVPASGIARWDGTSWHPLGTGLTGGTGGLGWALATLPSGDLVAGGYFNKAGDVNANNIALWNGSNWSPLGSGLVGGDQLVWALHVLSNGDLLAGGEFAFAGGLPASGIARWNGAEWSSLGAGISAGTDGVHTIAELPNGDVIAGGYFFQAGGSPARNIARWDGSAWHTMDSLAWPSLGSSVESLVVLPNGDLIVGGQFDFAGSVPASRVARWVPSTQTWSPLDPGFGGYYNGYGAVFELAMLADGDLVASGGFTSSGDVARPFLARWACIAPPVCGADCDGSGSLNIDDFICFQTLFALGDPAADCDASGSLNIDDFICFQTFFSLGC